MEVVVLSPVESVSAPVVSAPEGPPHPTTRAVAPVIHKRWVFIQLLLWVPFHSCTCVSGAGPSTHVSRSRRTMRRTHVSPTATHAPEREGPCRWKPGPGSRHTGALSLRRASGSFRHSEGPASSERPPGADEGRALCPPGSRFPQRARPVESCFVFLLDNLPNLVGVQSRLAGRGRTHLRRARRAPARGVLLNSSKLTRSSERPAVPMKHGARGPPRRPLTAEGERSASSHHRIKTPVPALPPQRRRCPCRPRRCRQGPRRRW